ncbi:MAG: hypothetical protein MUE36_12200 [Acidimicrobiales bacterium]|nr:hypothetical protein [Acidimicrobiales bacterium]
MESDSKQPASTRTRTRRVGFLLAAVTIAATAACSQDSTDTAAGPLDTASQPSATESVSCERPPITGTGDAGRYPASLDEMITDSDVVVEGRIVGDVGEATEVSQPMEVAVVETYRGSLGDNLTVQRLQTQSTVTGTPGTSVGSWSGEPWYCPGEVYMLFLQRQPDGTFYALPRLGAIPIEPRPDDQTLASWQAPEPFRSLTSLDADALRSQVKTAADRATS